MLHPGPRKTAVKAHGIKGIQHRFRSFLLQNFSVNILLPARVQAQILFLGILISGEKRKAGSKDYSNAVIDQPRLVLHLRRFVSGFDIRLCLSQE